MLVMFWKVWARHLLFVTLCMVVLGCAVVGTRDIGSPETVPLGKDYSLPRGLVPISLSVVPAAATFSVVLGPEPIMVPDPAHDYILKYNWSPTADDNWQIKTSNSLLDLISITTEDRLDQIILEAVKSISAVQESSFIGGTNAVTFFTDTFDPTDSSRVGDVETSINKLIHDLTKDIDKYNCVPNFSTLKRAEQALCQEYRRIKKKSGANQFVRLGIGLPNAKSFSKKPRCDIGICYRSVKPHKVVVNMGTNTSLSKTFMLPNSSPVIAFDLTRAAFVKKVIKLDFTDGILEDVHVHKPAELEELAKLPFEVSKLLISVPTEIVKLRINQDNARASEIESAGKLREARQNARVEQAKTENAALLQSARSGNFLGSTVPVVSGGQANTILPSLVPNASGNIQGAPGGVGGGIPGQKISPP